MDTPAFRVSLREYADPFDSYAAAIADARKHGRMVCKYADPSEGERLDITDDEAADVMLADIGLLYISPRQNATGGAH